MPECETLTGRVTKTPESNGSSQSAQTEGFDGLDKRKTMCACLFYRDSREKTKPLSYQEKKEMMNLENRGRPGSGSVFSYSPRKERALKIYLDTTPPRRREEADVD